MKHLGMERAYDNDPKFKYLFHSISSMGYLPLWHIDESWTAIENLVVKEGLWLKYSRMQEFLGQ